MTNTFLRYRGLIKETLFSLYQKVKFTFFWACSKDKQVSDISNFELKVYSQNGEVGIIKIIFHKIGSTNKFFVELGSGNGKECNTRMLLKAGWSGLQLDCQKTKNPAVKKEFVTAENVEGIFKKYRVPKNFDLLTIDIDGNDYWIWKALQNYHPRVEVIEYNASIPSNDSKVIPYNPNFKWDKTNYFGASLKALTRLAKQKGYLLIGCDSTGTNAFFILKKLVKRHFKTLPFTKLFRPRKYGIEISGLHIGHRKSFNSKQFQTV